MLLTAFVWNELVFLGARLITGSRRHYDMTTAFSAPIFYQKHSPCVLLFSLISAISVCISTLTTRQHVIADAVSGILIAEFAYFVCAYPKMRKAYSAVISKLTSIFKK